MKPKFVIFQAAMLGFFVLGLWLIQNSDLFVHLFIAKPKRAQLGKVDEVDGDVRRRPAKELMWVPVRSGDSIYEEDIYFTGPESKVRLGLDQSTKIRVNEDSLLQVERQGNLNVVDLKNGEIDVSSQSGETLDIKQEGRMISTKLPQKETRISKKRLADPEYQRLIQAKGLGESEAPANENQESQPNDEKPTEVAQSENTPPASTSPPEEEDREHPKHSLHLKDPLVLGFTGLYGFVIVLSLIDQLRQRRSKGRS